ncbi:MAG TPA: hypothetical protein VNM70_08530, partial [Burkholderiales bacterium]|nr:hypothetical protein [Burkholderiales bacterium]
SASFIAIWLKPQLRHSISTNAMAPGVSARPVEGEIFWGALFLVSRLERRVVMVVQFSPRHSGRNEAIHFPACGDMLRRFAPLRKHLAFVAGNGGRKSRSKANHF